MDVKDIKHVEDRLLYIANAIGDDSYKYAMYEIGKLVSFVRKFIPDDMDKIDNK